HLATAGLDHAVRIWRIDGENTHQETAFCDPRLAEIRAIAHLPRGGLLVSASGLGGRIWHWQWSEGREASFQALDASPCATSLAVALDGKHVAGACGNQIFIWVMTRDQFKLRGTLPSPSEVSALAFSADSRRLFAGRVSGEVQVWSDGWRGFRQDGAFVAHTGPVHCLTVSPNDRMVATSGTDNAVGIWSNRTAELQAKVPAGSHGVIRLLQFALRGDTLATVSDGGQVACWRSTDGLPDMAWRLNQMVSSSFALAEHFEVVAAARTDGTVCLYQLTNALTETKEADVGKT